MRFSHAWLLTYVGAGEDPARVGERLTAAGIPLDGIERRGDDSLYDFDIFTNRPDCMNHFGLAREYAALTGTTPRPPSAPIPPGGRPTADVASVAIEDPDLCARYAARCVLGVRVGPSPDWLRRRLEAIGQRSINNVVDATNFVLWELGHPLHPFDLDRLDGRRIVVRRARPGETLRTLDGVERALSPEMLVIADARRPVALAGVMGGEASEIGERTRNVLLESAWFEPVPVRRAARALGLRTDASHRFERGADPEGVITALDRAAHLVQEVAGGSVTAPPLDACPRPHRPRTVRFRPARARALLGLGLDDRFMREALSRLHFRIGPAPDGAWSIEVPSFRRDVEREVDLIEEVARHRGYDAIPSELPVLPGADEGRSPFDRTLLSACRAMQASGFSEAINYAMVDREDCRQFTPEIDPPLALTNPLQSNAAFLRTSLLPGLLRNAAHNLNHGLPGLYLFETGAVFLPASPVPRERRRLGFVLAGRGLPSHWSLPRRDVDLYDARGAVELLAEVAGVAPLAFSSDRIPFLEEGRALRVAGGGRPLGFVGEIRRAVLDGHGVDVPVFGGEIDLDDLAAGNGRVRSYRALPRYPAVRRDLAIVTAPGTTFAAIESAVRRAGRLPITEVQVFDLYRGPGIPAGCASLAVQIVFQHPERTLTAQEVQESIESITATLGRELGAKLRGTESP
ncbi:MAG: phenylalanine--tRNA ligase subunit beta [Acidobacteria bacterium]|nr:phenylalanine--tRNA ligase subunit beta [Acidobacteriota bacterium]